MTERILLITSGVLPAEARRFAFLLANHLEQLAETRGLEVREVVCQGEGADDASARGPRSIMIRIGGDTSLLAAELGTHVLIHRSHTRGRGARKRWFAAVSLHEPIVEDVRIDIASIPRDSLVITACRAGGPGGQHVNKVSSAVRVHHVPSGLSIRSAGARSQTTNLDYALRRLADLLSERAQARQAAAASARRDAHYQLQRGRAVRTYRLSADGRLVRTLTRSPS